MPWDRLPSSGAAVSDVTIDTDIDVRLVPNVATFGLVFVIDCHDFTLDAGVTLSGDGADDQWAVWIRATGIVTINGRIDGDEHGQRGGSSVFAPWSGGPYAGVANTYSGGGAHQGGGLRGGWPTPGFGGLFGANDPYGMPFSGSGPTSGSRAGYGIAISARRVAIGSAGEITSRGASRLSGSGAGGAVGILCDEFVNEHASDAIVNPGGTSANNASEGRRELYYRSARPAVVEGETLGPTPNEFTAASRSAAEALRDAQSAAWLAQYDDEPTFTINAELAGDADEHDLPSTAQRFMGGRYRAGLAHSPPLARRSPRVDRATN